MPEAQPAEGHGGEDHPVDGAPEVPSDSTGAGEASAHNATVKVEEN